MCRPDTAATDGERPRSRDCPRGPVEVCSRCPLRHAAGGDAPRSDLSNAKWVRRRSPKDGNFTRPGDDWRKPRLAEGFGPGRSARGRPQTADLGPRNRGNDSRDINAQSALTRDTRPRKRLSMPRETTRRDLRDGRPGTRPRHSAGPPRETSAHATPCGKRRTHAAQRERPGREARAFTLNLLARQFRARLLK